MNVKVKELLKLAHIYQRFIKIKYPVFMERDQWPAEMWEAQYGLWSAEYLESAEKMRIFRRRYIVGS